MVSDPAMCSNWSSMARLLSLETFIPVLEVTKSGRRTDKQRLKELLNIWKRVKPDTYTVQKLLNVLDTLV